MKFKKKIEICRHDDRVPISSFMINNAPGSHCMHNADGKCLMDKKPCKIITYERTTKKEVA